MIRKCINPRNVNYTIRPDGKHNLIFNKPLNKSKPYFTLKCSKCLYCQQQYSKNWAVRLQLESLQHTESYFLTLTYDDEHLPRNNTLVKKDLQNFIKRYRRNLEYHHDKKIRYFAAGEYGSRKGRAHYHLIIFGHKPDDLEFLKQTNKDEAIFTSNYISKLWKKGFISIGVNMTVDSLKYAAKYLGKMNDHNPITQIPPFNCQSTAPGIGAKYIATYKLNTGRKLIIEKLNTDHYETDGIYLSGKKYQPPKYFDKLAEQAGINIDHIKQARIDKMEKYTNIMPTRNDKKIYYDYSTTQGYSTDHLFRPSKNRIRYLKYRVCYNKKTGTIDTVMLKYLIDKDIKKSKKEFFTHINSKTDIL